VFFAVQDPLLINILPSPVPVSYFLPEFGMTMNEIPKFV